MFITKAQENHLQRRFDFLLVGQPLNPQFCDLLVRGLNATMVREEGPASIFSMFFFTSSQRILEKHFQFFLGNFSGPWRVGDPIRGQTEEFMLPRPCTVDTCKLENTHLPCAVPQRGYSEECPILSAPCEDRLSCPWLCLLGNAQLIIGFFSLFHSPLPSPELPRIVFQIYFFHSNPYVRVCFWEPNQDRHSKVLSLSGLILKILTFKCTWIDTGVITLLWAKCKGIQRSVISLS